MSAIVTSLPVVRAAIFVRLLLDQGCIFLDAVSVSNRNAPSQGDVRLITLDRNVVNFFVLRRGVRFLHIYRWS